MPLLHIHVSITLMLFSVASVFSQPDKPDQTACENNGAYDTRAGQASCNNITVDFFALMCGNGFSQKECVAKFTNADGFDEEFFFMGAGSGISVSDVPDACKRSQMGKGFAMVQYIPQSDSCFPVAMLEGTTASYTASANGKDLASVTLTFSDYHDGSVTRDGYMKITAGQLSGFTTTGDSEQKRRYAISVTAPCGTFRCIDNTCKHVDGGSGSSYIDCNLFCGDPLYRCEEDKCVIAVDGSPLEDCAQVCGPPPRFNGMDEK